MGRSLARRLDARGPSVIGGVAEVSIPDSGILRRRVAEEAAKEPAQAEQQPAARRREQRGLLSVAQRRQPAQKRPASTSFRKAMRPRKYLSWSSYIAMWLPSGQCR